MFKNRSKLAFAAALLGTLYTIYLFTTLSESAVDTGGAIAFMLVLPHLVCNFLASIFAWFGFKNNSKGMMITALVLFSVAIVLFLVFFMYDLPMVILSALAISKVSKLRSQSAE
ncbi:hypothetical protein RZE82_05960 [Mollicutes bacterium LVI A0039]|nr:hypothetical protein RZE82_05960 [Mollicutes bacterium LVI A0039]